MTDLDKVKALLAQQAAKKLAVSTGLVTEPSIQQPFGIPGLPDATYRPIEKSAEITIEDKRKKTSLSFDSQVFTTLMACARLTDFRFNHNLTSIHGKSKSLEMGSIVHTFLETYFKTIIAGQFRSVAVEKAMEAAIKYSNSNEVTNTSPEDRQWALNTCEQYIAYYKNDHWVPLEVEVVKGKQLYEDDEVRILWKAKCDLIVDTNQGIYPVDHKTMSQRRDTTTLNNQFIGQCLVNGTRNVIINKIGFQKSLKAEEKFTRHVVSYSADRLNEWQSEILPFYAKLYLGYHEAEYWPPNFTHCENKYGFCTFRSVCESDRGMRQIELGNNFVVGEVWDINNEE